MTSASEMLSSLSQPSKQRGAPAAANKTLKSIKTFLGWCVGRAILDKSPADGVPLPAREEARDRILSDVELAKVIRVARTMAGPYGEIIEFLALTGQRREEVTQATWDEFDFDQQTWTLPKMRTKNGKSHVVHLSAGAIAVLKRRPKRGAYVFTINGAKPFSRFSAAKRKLDALCGVTGWRLHDLRRTCVSGMARLGVAPHVADKVLNHQSGTISGVAAVYQRHDFLAERKEALDRWAAHVLKIVAKASVDGRSAVQNGSPEAALDHVLVQIAGRSSTPMLRVLPLAASVRMNADDMVGRRRLDLTPAGQESVPFTRERS